MRARNRSPPVATMKMVSAAEMRDIDRATSERFGVSSVTLIENAGSAVPVRVLRVPGCRRIGVLLSKAAAAAIDPSWP